MQAQQQPPNVARAERDISEQAPPSLYKVPAYSTRAGAAPCTPGGARHGGGNRAVTSQSRTATSYGDMNSAYREGRQVGHKWVRKRGTPERQQTGGGATQTHKTREPHQEGRGRAQQGKVLAPGSASGKHPFCVVCVRVALVVLCGGCGVGVLLCCAVCCFALPLYARAPLVCVALYCSSVRLRQLCVPGRCAILCCSGVCCAALFHCAPLSALACCTVLCAVLHQQRTVATATRATATLFYGGQVPVTSEDLDAATHP